MVQSPASVQIATYDFGGTGQDVLFAHATGFCGAIWAPMFEQLTGVRGVAYDTRGHGHSELPDSLDWTLTADDVLAVIDHYGLVKPVGVGHSMGGASLAMAELKRPGTFSALWLFEPIILPGEDHERQPRENPLSEGARRRRPRFDSFQAAFDNYASKPPLNAFDPNVLAHYVSYGFAPTETGDVHLRCLPETEATTFTLGASHDTFNRAREITCHVDIVCGAEDAYGPASIAPDQAKQFAHSTLQQYDKLSHFGPLQDPHVLAESVQRAVSSVHAQ